jgi:hypothetical protein
LRSILRINLSDKSLRDQTFGEIFQVNHCDQTFGEIGTIDRKAIDLTKSD